MMQLCAKLSVQVAHVGHTLINTLLIISIVSQEQALKNLH